MNLSWKLGRVAGIDLYLHPTFLLLLAYLGTFQGGLLAVLLASAVFGCVLLHELGHALAARLYGIRTEDITLYPIGGVARLSRLPRKPGVELLITLAGPAVNVAIAAALAALLALAGLVAPLGADETLALSFLTMLMWVNLALAVFNLVPAFPMDGGRVLRALLSGWLGRLRATEIASSLGKALAAVFGIYSLLNGQVLHAILALFIFVAATLELARVRQEEHQHTRRPTDPEGIWIAPTGHHWVRTGNGVWQLAPIVVRVEDGYRWG